MKYGFEIPSNFDGSSEYSDLFINVSLEIDAHIMIVGSQHFLAYSMYCFYLKYGGLSRSWIGASRFQYSPGSCQAWGCQ